MYVPAMESIAVSEARAKLPELLTRVEGGVEITITRHGRAIAILVSPDAWHYRRGAPVLAEAEQVHDLLAAARAMPLPAESGLSESRADELMLAVRAGREAR
jgi:prevent-host-death family protein